MRRANSWVGHFALEFRLPDRNQNKRPKSEQVHQIGFRLPLGISSNARRIRFLQWASGIPRARPPWTESGSSKVVYWPPESR